MDHRRKAPVFLFLAFLAGVAIPSSQGCASQPGITVSQHAGISVNVENETVDAVLRMMAKQKLLEVRGALAGSERLSLHFANLTLTEALAKVMRGYNYVLVEQGKDQAPVLSVMGRIERAKAPSASVVATAAPAARQPEQRSYVPPDNAAPQPGQAHQPALQGGPAGAQQPQPGREGQPAGGQAQQSPSPPAYPAAPGAPDPRTAQAAGSGQQAAGGGQQPTGQGPAGATPAPAAPQPPEPEGVHF